MAAADLFLVNSPLALGFSCGISTFTKFSSLVFLVRGLECPSPLDVWVCFAGLWVSLNEREGRPSVGRTGACLREGGPTSFRIAVQVS